MDLLNHVIPPAVLLLGASNLTRALYGFVPGFADHHVRFVPLGLALVLTAVYAAIVFVGRVLRLRDVPPDAANHGHDSLRPWRRISDCVVTHRIQAAGQLVRPAQFGVNLKI